MKIFKLNVWRTFHSMRSFMSHCLMSTISRSVSPAGSTLVLSTSSKSHFSVSLLSNSRGTRQCNLTIMIGKKWVLPNFHVKAGRTHFLLSSCICNPQFQRHYCYLLFKLNYCDSMNWSINRSQGNFCIRVAFERKFYTLGNLLLCIVKLTSWLIKKTRL